MPKLKKRLLIIGAGEAARLLLKEIKKNPLLSYWVEGFVDDFKTPGDKINGISVLGKMDEIPEVVKNKGIEEIIIAIPSLKKDRLLEIIEICKRTRIEPKIMPSTYEGLYSLETGRPWYKEVRSINLEDLLKRKPVFINPGEIKKYISGKTVLVTGGGGSIGSELCIQIAELSPKKIIVLDNTEYNLYKIDRLLRERYPELQVSSAIIDVRDQDSLERLFMQNKIDLVFHAAAYKHVPLMESNVREAVKNNIFGTYNVASTSEKFKVKNFVMISTDKAVNPTSVMGATKLISEKIIQSFGKATRFVTVRFGNVLGSTGSVIPLFEEQVKKGGPVTITHPEITRYFMTIPEAAQLVIQAGAIGKNKQIMVLDMGKPYKVVDIAKDLIRLYGLEPDKDIKIKYVGLRPGEKLYEELLTRKENLTKTENERIFISRAEEENKVKVESFLKELKNGLNKFSDKEIRDRIKSFLANYSPKKNKGAVNKYQDLRTKKIIITGSNGFIGKHLKKKLKKLRINFYEANRSDGIDLADEKNLGKLKRAEVVFHLASSTPQGSNRNYSADIKAMQNILDYCKKNNSFLVFTSSSGVYGNNPKSPVKESKAKPENEYAKMKAVCEEMFRKSGVSGTILRIFNAYGKDQKGNFLIPSLIEGVKKGEISLDRGVARDMIYVSDIVNAILKSTINEKARGEIYNIGSGKAFPLDEIKELVFEQMKKKVKINYREPRREQPKIVFSDISKAKKDLGWEPKIGLAEGVRLTFSS